MNERIERALSKGGVIDITTSGARSGQPRRIEIVFHVIDGRLYISGHPRPEKRAWLANLEANPRFTFHLKNGLVADLPATARVVADEAERRRVLPSIARAWKLDLEHMVRESPLVEVTIEPEARPEASPEAPATTSR